MSSDCSTFSRRSACGVILLLRRQREQRIGAQLGAPDAAAQLIKLRQAEPVGAMHDQRIGGRNVEAGLDDGRRQQHVIFAVVEGRHDVVEHGRRHLAVRDRDAHLRNILVEKLLGARQILDARTHIERLPAAIFLAQQCLANRDWIEWRHESPHRQTIDRRRRDDGEVAHAGERQLQGARDRRRGQREHVHFRAQRLELLLVRDAEMLLLVDDQQRQVLEFDVLAEQRMRADHDIDAAVREARPHLGSTLQPAPAATPAQRSPGNRGSARKTS